MSRSRSVTDKVNDSEVVTREIPVKYDRKKRALSEVNIVFTV